MNHRVKYKSIKVMMPHCDQCGEQLRGENSVVRPYKCSCGVWIRNLSTKNINGWKISIDAISVKDLGLSQRTVNRLLAGDADTIYDMFEIGKETLLNWTGINENTIDEINKTLKKYKKKLV